MSKHKLKNMLWFFGLLSLAIYGICAYLIYDFTLQNVGWISTTFIYGSVFLLIFLVLLIKKEEPSTEIFNEKF